MAITFSLGAEPLWILIDTDGKTAGGGFLYTYDNLTRLPKAVFQDPAGLIPWTNPIIFNLNGVQGPFYFEVDSSNPEDTYYLEATNAQGIQLWNMEEYTPPSGGGGSVVTEFIPLTNYIANNQFIDHADDMSVVANVTYMRLAPSNHKGFTPSANNPIVGDHGVVGPDIIFVKNDTGIASDKITFPDFPLSGNQLTPLGITPVTYIRYQCSGSPAGESYKAFQFPITQKVKNLSTQAMTFSFWAKVTTTPVTIQPYSRQYFGSAPTAQSPNPSTNEIYQQIGAPITLTSSWVQYVIPFNMPDVSLGTIGSPGAQTDDDAVYIQLGLPLGTPCDIQFTKPALFLGTVNSPKDFDDYDQIDSIDQTPRVGDIKPGFNFNAPPGWVSLNDGTIGNLGSGATNRANKDTFQLYSTIYTSISDTWAPLVPPGRTAPGNTMAAAITDFLANKPITLPSSLGRAMAQQGAGAGLTARVLGEYAGASTVTLTSTNLPIGTPFNAAGSGNGTVATGFDFDVPFSMSAYTEGGGTSFSTLNPTTYMNFYIKL